MLALALAGCSNAITAPLAQPTPTYAPAGVLLTGPATDLHFVSQGQPGAILVPAQIRVPANDYARVSAGPSPQASMRPIIPVPGPFYTNTIVYTAVTFTAPTAMQHALGLTFELPASIDAQFGTFYLAAYRNGYWHNVASTHGSAESTDRIAFQPSGGTSTYADGTPHGVALYQLADVEQPVPMPDPSSLTFTAVGQTAEVRVMETDYYGGWTATSSNEKVAVVSSQGGARFLVTSVGAGKASIVFSDSAHGTGTARVGVTTSGGGIH